MGGIEYEKRRRGVKKQEIDEWKKKNFSKNHSLEKTK